MNPVSILVFSVIAYLGPLGQLNEEHNCFGATHPGNELRSLKKRVVCVALR